MTTTSLYETIINARLRGQLEEKQRETEEEMVALYIEHAKHVQSYDFQCDDACATSMINVHEWLCSKKIVPWPILPAVEVCQQHERLFYNKDNVAACQLASLYYDAFLKPPPPPIIIVPEIISEDVPLSMLNVDQLDAVEEDVFLKTPVKIEPDLVLKQEPLKEEVEPCTEQCCIVSVPMTLYLAKKWNPPWLPMFVCTQHSTLHLCHGNNIVCRNRKSAESTICMICLIPLLCETCQTLTIPPSCASCNVYRICAECHQRGNVRCMSCMEAQLCTICRRSVQARDTRCITCLQHRLCLERCPMNMNNVDHDAAHICFFSKRVVGYLSSNEDLKHRRVAQSSDFVPLRNNRAITSPAKYAETAITMLQQWLQAAIRHSEKQKQEPPTLVNRQTALARITSMLIDTSIVDEETGVLTIVPRDIWQFMPLLYVNVKQITRLPAVASDTLTLYDVSRALYTAYNDLSSRRMPLAEVMKRLAEDGVTFHTISHEYEYDKHGNIVKILATYSMKVGVTPLLQNYALRMRECCPNGVSDWLEKTRPPPPESNAPPEPPYCAAVQAIKMFPTFYCLK